MSIDAIADLCYGAGGTTQQQLEDALAVILAESGGDASASFVNTSPPSSARYAGSVDRGLMQINSVAHPTVTDAIAYDPAGNVREGYRISGGFHNFAPWSTWPTRANAKRAQARAAAAARIAKGGTGSLAGASAPSPTPAGNVDSLGISPDTPWVAGALPSGYIVPLDPAGGRIVGMTSTTDKTPLVGLVLGGTVDLTADEVSEINLELYNGTRTFLAGGRTALSARLELGPFDYRISAEQLNPTDYGSTVTLACRPRGVQGLRHPSIVAGVTNAPSLNNISPTEYVERVARGQRLRILGEGSARRATIAPTKKGDRLETAWEVFLRLAEEEGYICFEAADVIHFGRPTWLLDRGTEVKVGWGNAWGSAELDAIGEPEFRRTEDGWRDAGITVSIPRHRGELIRPGMRMLTKGVYGLGASVWLITRVSWPFDGGLEPVSVDGIIPQDPTPTLEDNTSGLPTDGSTTPPPGTPADPGQGNVLDFVTHALAQAGDTYVFGAEAQPNDQDPEQFDCSELVQWAAARCNVTITDGTWLQYRAIEAAKLTKPIATAIATRGALLFHFSSDPTVGGRPSSAHVAISLGDGRTIEAQNSRVGVVIGNAANRGWTHAGLVPGLNYGTPGDYAIT